MKSKRNKIVFIGAGNVASAIAKTLHKKHDIVQVYSKSNAHAEQLASVLHCSFTNSLKKIVSDADIYIIAVKDDAIEQVASVLRLGNKLVLHTSGAIDISPLKKISNRYGVLYPLQTFSKDSLIKKGIPFCIEASDKNVKTELEELVKELKGEVHVLNSKQRARLHLAAVFVNNFTNHMFAIAEDILNEDKIPFDLLLPLIDETITKIKYKSPFQSQTGPALRKDKKTIKKHEKMLSDKPDYLSIYKQMTKSIQHIHSHAKKL
jgi:predicted short-subunit dehydrogenase-like oxidoreductase (DUF2520 family)